LIFIPCHGHNKKLPIVCPGSSILFATFRQNDFTVSP
jgi:hypothetical protein